LYLLVAVVGLPTAGAKFFADPSTNQTTCHVLPIVPVPFDRKRDRSHIENMAPTRSIAVSDSTVAGIIASGALIFNEEGQPLQASFGFALFII
jgi:hypothetical protein